MLTNIELKPAISTNPFEEAREIPGDLDVGTHSPFLQNLVKSTPIPTNAIPQEPLKNNQNTLSELQDKLKVLIDTMSHNQSLLSRIASFWGELPLWQKIIAGFVLTVPCFVLGIVANIWGLIAVSVFTLIAYTTCSLLLDNHYQNSTQTSDGLKTGMASLGNVLLTLIDSLEVLQQQFSQAVDDLTMENHRLKENINHLEYQVGLLTQHVADLQETERGLRTIRDELEATTKKMTKSLEQQMQLAQTNQDRLNQTQIEYRNAQSQLSEKILELDAVKKEMASKIEQFQVVNQVLSETVITITQAAVADEAQKAIFQEKLERFLENKEESFDRIAERICEAEHQLAEVSKQLILSKEQYQEFLERQELQIVRFENMIKIESPESPHQQSSSTKILSRIGLYAEKEAISVDQESMVFQAVLSAF